MKEMTLKNNNEKEKERKNERERERERERETKQMKPNTKGTFVHEIDR